MKEGTYASIEKQTTPRGKGINVDISRIFILNLNISVTLLRKLQSCIGLLYTSSNILRALNSLNQTCCIFIRKYIVKNVSSYKCYIFNYIYIVPVESITNFSH